jgi:hypothetical protein
MLQDFENKLIDTRCFFLQLNKLFLGKELYAEFTGFSPRGLRRERGFIGI